MAILKVARMGHPVLRRVAEPVPPTEIQKSSFQEFVDDMIETMREYDGVGLAAPQVHHSVRVSVVQLPAEASSRTQKGLYVFINPEVKVLSNEKNTYWEGCLSVPGLRGLVARPNKIRVKYLDRNGKSDEIVAEGFLATVLQHEFDHLDGKLYIDRLTDMTKLVFEEEYQKYWLPDAGEDEDDL